VNVADDGQQDAGAQLADTLDAGEILVSFWTLVLAADDLAQFDEPPI